MGAICPNLKNGINALIRNIKLRIYYLQINNMYYWVMPDNVFYFILLK